MSAVVQETIEYKGWKLWRWTGWKARYGKTVVPPEGHHFDKECSVCKEPFIPGQEINTQQNGDAHWTCANPNNEPNYYMGQWLFVKLAPDPNDNKYCYVNVPPAGMSQFDRGSNFDVDAAKHIVTDSTSEEEKERLKGEGLTRMYALIDQLESEGY